MLNKNRGKEVCKVLEKIWKTLSDLLTDLKEKGFEPPHILEISMEGAKIMINLCIHHPKLEMITNPKTLDSIQGFCVACCGQDAIARIECELKNIQDLLTIKAFELVGEDYVLRWQNKLKEYWEELSKVLEK